MYALRSGVYYNSIDRSVLICINYIRLTAAAIIHPVEAVLPGADDSCTQAKPSEDDQPVKLCGGARHPDKVRGNGQLKGESWDAALRNGIMGNRSR